MKKLKIGLVIADDMEYAPLLEIGGEEHSFFGRDGHKFRFADGNREIELYAVCCGIGKVNAATAAMHLIDSGCKIMLNTGLSGGMSGILRGELTLCTRYVEYDFDLTPLGYKKAEKPSQQYIYEGDPILLDHFAKLYKSARRGMAVTGDRFVSDFALREELCELFAPMSCDMETAAVASVCHMAGVPFFAIRRISDDAGADATVCYREMNENEKFQLAVLVIEGVKQMLYNDRLFAENE